MKKDKKTSLEVYLTKEKFRERVKNAEVKSVPIGDLKSIKKIIREKERSGEREKHKAIFRRSY